jgi:hypothetical protein
MLSVIFVSKHNKPEPRPIDQRVERRTYHHLHFGRTEELMLQDQYQQDRDKDTGDYLELYHHAES